MPTVHPSPAPLNPAVRLADTLSLFVDALDAGHLDLAARVLLRAWRLHEAWPLGLHPELRDSALRALVSGERALVTCRNAALAIEADAIVAAEGWTAGRAA